MGSVVVASAVGSVATLGSLEEVTSAGAEPVGRGVVDVTETSADDAPVDDGCGSGEVGRADVVGSDALEVSVTEDVGAADDGAPSAHAKVVAQHNQHAAMASDRTATNRRRVRRLPRMTNKLQSPETDASRLKR